MTDISDCFGPDQPDWVTSSDHKIIAILASGLILSPAVIAENTDITRETVCKHLKSLQAAGVVEKVRRGKYRLAVSSDQDFEIPRELICATRFQEASVQDGDPDD
ncbi:helix-turn-helix domain-containing protein [Haloarcula sp. CBA1122]|uniref:helix-turn-helix domain-containing protein n=1 Tax=Haloarcula sp. CBA1122 TaxID=2668069 RepID=UPI0013088A27|nr:helix-turn-helix domain-containing protein [Haloarcula sp. CBA1122]MUV49098.1 HTH domain-containing protein [Haloarcula sp. CBA1122]